MPEDILKYGFSTGIGIMIVGSMSGVVSYIPPKGVGWKEYMSTLDGIFASLALGAVSTMIFFTYFFNLYSGVNY
jgi:hypothetical protein